MLWQRFRLSDDTEAKVSEGTSGSVRLSQAQSGWIYSERPPHLRMCVSVFRDSWNNPPDSKHEITPQINHLHNIRHILLLLLLIYREESLTDVHEAGAIQDKCCNESIDYLCVCACVCVCVCVCVCINCVSLWPHTDTHCVLTEHSWSCYFLFVFVDAVVQWEEARQDSYL